MMLEKLMVNPYVWGVLALITVLSLCYAIYCQQKNKEKKEFSYWKQSVSLIMKKKSKNDKLSVCYDGQQIEDLAVSKFIIWNSGNKSLSENDMVASKELTITCLDDHVILDMELIAQTEETNRFSINLIDNHTAKIYFDYADENDGIVLQIIHTGTERDLKLECKIKGGKPIRNVGNITPLPRFQRTTRLKKVLSVVLAFDLIMMFLLAVVCSICIFNLSLQHIIFPSTMMQLDGQKNAIAMSICTWIFFLTMTVPVFFSIKTTFYNIGVPKALKQYSELSQLEL